MTLSKLEQRYAIGYATALQDIMRELTGENTCGKSYDPATFDETTLHSYAFNLKDGGRHHPLSDYKDVDELTNLMLKEAVLWIR